MDWKKDRHLTFARSVRRGVSQRLEGWGDRPGIEVSFDYDEDENDINKSTLQIDVSIGDHRFEKVLLEKSLGGENSALAEHVAEEISAMWVRDEHIRGEDE